MTSRPLPARLYTALLICLVVGVLTFVIGLFVQPDRVWNAFHANWLFFAGLSSAATTIVAVQRITTARWSREIIRFLEGFVAFLPVAFLFLLLTVFAGKHYVFPWGRGEAYPVPEKALYYGQVFFTVRVLLTFAIIAALSVWYVYTCVRLDVGMNPEWQGAGDRARFAGLRARMRNGFRDERREIHSTHSLQGTLAVVLVIAFAWGWSVLAWDLSMGLTLHFQSTLYSWWFFMGAWLSAVAMFALFTMWWRRYLGAYDLVKEVHFHDLGKLLFAFTAFWGYLTFGQYLVIWYGNMGEETHFMRLRLIAPWKWITVLSASMVFVLPFFGLLTRATKVILPWLTFFAASSAIGMWLMRYIEVYPSAYGLPLGAPFGLWEIGVLLLYVGVWGWCYATFMDAFPRVRATLLTSPYRDEVQVPVDPETMEPLPAHE
ncbi:MAG TPA: hypothetical protein VJ867_13265 [Gemmatimonadaceae bacterium]|nr:hypothetical protein [Gemmatimonadaceae bacterium]